MKKFKILIPKAGVNNELGTETRLYTHNEEIDAKEEWQENLMNTFVANGWAIELKVDAPKEVKRARNDKGQLLADDPSTPDVNEAWEGGEAPKKTTKKKTTKKSTKKS